MAFTHQEVAGLISCGNGFVSTDVCSRTYRVLTGYDVCGTGTVCTDSAEDHNEKIKSSRLLVSWVLERFLDLKAIQSLRVFFLLLCKSN